MAPTRTFDMRAPVLLAALLLPSTSIADAQCFFRNRTCDPNAMEVRSQLNVTVPIADKASPGEAYKAVEDARRQLSSLLDRELEAMKSIYGGETTLKASSLNSNMQDNDSRGRTANVSMMNTYEVKRPN